ncbi:hypothetical protein Slin15195_G036300 [Septoria linicola]|uniref:Uncharacterized protein n=1 Tax=Septoria linicola TaxID=215465 RepID=A0A9Q9EFZ8_9PEZI|nr:hypothetical protein Slin14017_G117710 [Septoria linicola]USW50311.1 hypothetical protein Slin15195_G036300 [Septoria linicola]
MAASHADRHNRPLGRGLRKKRPSRVQLEIQEAKDFIGPSPPSSTGRSSSKTMTTRGPGRPSKRQKITSSPEPRSVRATNGMIIPSFSSKTFRIYDWDAPQADLRFPKISQGRRDEKTRRDIREAGSYIDDGSDDWYAFEGRVDTYDGRMAETIARIFVNRAKVAHGQSWAWNRFEDDELEVRTQAAARAERDPAKRAELIADSLCEKSRLEVFDRIKERLCNEVFLENYDHNRVAEDRRRQDSMIPSITTERREEIAEDEKTVARFVQDEGSVLPEYKISHNWGRYMTQHTLPALTPVYKDEDEIEPYRKNAHFSKICRKCGEDLQLGRCPRCKHVEDAVEPNDP